MSNRASRASKSKQAEKQAEIPMSDIPEDEDDPGRTESQQLLSVMKALTSKPTSKDNPVKDLRKRIKNDQAELEQIIQEGEADMEIKDTEWKRRLRSEFLNVLANNSADDQATRVLEQSRLLLQDYNHLSTVSSSKNTENHDALLEAWKADKEKVERLLSLGKRVAENRFALAVGQQVERDESEDYGEASRYFLKEGAKENDELRRALSGIESGVRKFGKVLPKDD